MVTTITEDFFMEHFQSQGAGQLQQLVKVSGRQRAHNPLFWVLRIRCEDFGQKPLKDGRVSHKKLSRPLHKTSKEHCARPIRNEHHPQLLQQTVPSMQAYALSRPNTEEHG